MREISALNMCERHMRAEYFDLPQDSETRQDVLCGTSLKLEPGGAACHC